MTNFRNRVSTLAILLGASLLSGPALSDQVIPDDLIVQGSACIGLDCVNNENFGFSTIVLKENNLRIRFQDTSVSAGFPANVWDITANDSASGGANYLAFDDITSGRQPFRVTAGAPTASLFVDSSGRLGLKTSTPTLELHMNDSDTPAIRMEQNNSGGFSAQTWDIGANEANFFVRDLTGGSRLPFRIRPGAPTSSIDIAANGNVGIATASPSNLGSGLTTTVLNVHHVSGVGQISLSSATTTAGAFVGELTFGTTGASSINKMSAAITSQLSGAATTIANGDLRLWTRNGAAITERMTIDTIGNVGIGTTAPAARLHTVGTVRFAGVTSCGAGLVTNGSGDLACLTSSRQFKNVTGDLAPATAVANIMALRPQVGSYKETPDVAEHWLIAEEAAMVDPAFVGLNDGKPYVVKTQNIVTDLVAVVQHQQRRIAELEQALRK